LNETRPGAIRCFAAIALPQSVKQALAPAQRRLAASGPKASWVALDQLHLTLRFLGEVPDELAADYANRMGDALAAVPSFGLRVCGVGCFPNPTEPRVVWAGVEGETNALKTVAAIAEREAVAAGCSPEPRAFQAHITLGRIRDTWDLGSFPHALENQRSLDAGDFSVRRVTLYESRLRRGGPTYVKLEDFPLGHG